MLGLILNETEIVKNTLEGKLELPSKPSKIIKMIIKKFIIDKKSDEEIKDYVTDLLKTNYGKNYNKNYWTSFIDNTIKILNKKENNKMIDINNIEIYKEEIDIIEVLNDLKLEKLAFILLVYAKINKKVNPQSNGKINIPLGYIIKESSLKKDDNSKLLLNELYNKKYILQGTSCDTTSIQINYMKDNGECVINIDDLRDYQPIKWYFEYKGLKKYKKCKHCGKRFEIKSKTQKPKYCPKCKKQKQKEWQKESMKKIRNNVKLI